MTYVIGIVLVQAAWLARLKLPEGVAVVGRLHHARAGGARGAPHRRARHPDVLHRHHIAERYGLFTLIVLGESIFAATTAIQTAADSGGSDAELIEVAGAGLVIVFAMWWVYFDRPMHQLIGQLRTALDVGVQPPLPLRFRGGGGRRAAGGDRPWVTADHRDQAAEAGAHGVEAVALSEATVGAWAVALPGRGVPAQRLAVADRDEAPPVLMLATPFVVLCLLIAPFTAAPVYAVAGTLAALVVLHIVVGHGETVANGAGLRVPQASTGGRCHIVILKQAEEAHFGVDGLPVVARDQRGGRSGSTMAAAHVIAAPTPEPRTLLQI